MRRDDTTRTGVGSARAVLLAALVAPLLASLTAAAPASGDLLVTRDGSQIETQGPWEVRGRLVVFTRPDGTLASMRLQDVHLEASEEATAAAEAAEEEAAEDGDGDDEEAARNREATWVLTDADFTRRLVIEDTGEPDGEGEETPGESSASDATRAPVVLSYERDTDLVDQHVRITGTLANQTRLAASAVSLEVSLFDEQGELIEMRRAEVTDPLLAPRAETTFQVDFPEVFSFAAIQFRPRSVNLESGEGGEAHVPGPEDAAREQDELAAEGAPEG